MIFSFPFFLMIFSYHQEQLLSAAETVRARAGTWWKALFLEEKPHTICCLSSLYGALLESTILWTPKTMKNSFHHVFLIEILCPYINFWIPQAVCHLWGLNTEYYNMLGSIEPVGEVAQIVLWLKIPNYRYDLLLIN